jgi:hypothetical protein
MDALSMLSDSGCPHKIGTPPHIHAYQTLTEYDDRDYWSRLNLYSVQPQTTGLRLIKHVWEPDPTITYHARGWTHRKEEPKVRNVTAQTTIFLQLN